MGSKFFQIYKGEAAAAKAKAKPAAKPKPKAKAATKACPKACTEASGRNQLARVLASPGREGRCYQGRVGRWREMGDTSSLEQQVRNHV